MTWLPNANDYAVGLNLIYIATFHPNVLSGDDGGSDDRRSNYGGCNYNGRRGRNGVINESAYCAADETGPEVSAAMSPAVAVMTVMMSAAVMTRSAVVHGRRGVMSASRPAMVSTTMRPRECSDAHSCHRDQY